MPAYTPYSNIPYPLGADPIRGTTSDNIRVDMQQLAEGADAGDVSAVGKAVAQTKTELQPRFAMVEDLAAEPGTHVENVIPDPAPVDAPSTWTAGNATLQQAPGWGRAIASGGSATSVRPDLGTGEYMNEPVSTGDPVGAIITIRAMSTQTITANVHIRGWSWDGASFTFVSNIASSGRKDIAPGVASTFTASGSVPSGVTHVDMFFSFTRLGQTYPSASDFAFFRNAALFAGTVPEPLAYYDGDSEYSYWTGEPGASTSVSMKPKAEGSGGSAAAHAVLLDDFTYRRGGPKKIGPKTSISFRIDHGLANFDSKMRAKLEQHSFNYALALGSRDWGASENSGITPTIVNNWVTGGLAEIWSHGPSHADADTPEKLYDYIVKSKSELESDLPAAVIDGFMPPGAGGTRYMGFGPSDTPQKYFDTLAGQLILQTYAIGTGQFPGTSYRLQDGRPRVGQAYFNMDTFTASEVMVRVNNAIAEGKGIQLMIHPSLIDTGGITTADVSSILDQIKALQDAGEVVVMSAYDQLLVDSSSEGILKLDTDGVPYF